MAEVPVIRQSMTYGNGIMTFSSPIQAFEINFKGNFEFEEVENWAIKKNKNKFIGIYIGVEGTNLSLNYQGELNVLKAYCVKNFEFLKVNIVLDGIGVWVKDSVHWEDDSSKWSKKENNYKVSRSIKT
jgi:hypothetical protein